MDYVAAAQAQALAYGVPPQLFNDIIQNESAFNPYAVNPSSGAAGIAQILPSTAANPGYGLPTVNPFDPNASLAFAAQYLKTFYNQFGNWSQAVLAYWKGPGYAAANPTATPYPGAKVQQDLAGLGGSTAPAGTAANTTPANAAQTSSGCSSWITTPGACFNDALSRAGFVVLGLIVVGVGIWMLSK